MSRQYIFLIGMLVVSFIGYSQILKKETFSNQGSSHFVNANNKSYFIQESIGQASVIFTYDVNNYSLRQGFLQPISASWLSDDNDTELDGFIYPNPFENDIHIRFDESVVDVLQVVLYDILGRIIFEKEFQPTQTLDLRFATISSGNYLLRITMHSQVLLAKLIKR